MKPIATDITDVVILEPEIFSDQRGYLYESYNRSTLAGLGIDAVFVQDNHSYSARHVLRGLHYQIHQPQGKLVRVISGEVLDVAVDLRRSSPTFGQHVSCILSADNRRLVWIPPGFAHGFLVRSDGAEVLYKATNLYAPEHERAIRWNDPVLAIDWQVTGEPVLSEKDRVAPLLAVAPTFP